MDQSLNQETLGSARLTARDFSEFERKVVYRNIRSRRDIRHFQSEPIPNEALARIIQAAHSGPSVGFMQPWDFVLIRNMSVRQEVQKLFRREREAAACFYDEPRRSQYLALKLEGILDSPINLCVTCDPTRGDVVLGRNAIPETDIYSTCCAVENLWLAARSEGIGVGWVSILKLPQLRNLLGIPAHIVPVAYLCLGYPMEFQDQPLLESVGWRHRVPLEELLHFDNWQDQSPEDAIWSGLDQALKLEAEDYKPVKPSEQPT